MGKNKNIRKMYINISFIIFSTILLSCSYLKPQSKLVEFNYGGFGDTIFSTLDGKIYEMNLSNKVPIDSVEIRLSSKTNESYSQFYDTFYKAYLFYPKDTLFFSNKEGNVYMNFIENEFVDIVISKNGYETLTLKNYHAHPDQFSTFEVILEKGDGSVVETIIENN